MLEKLKSELTFGLIIYWRNNIEGRVNQYCVRESRICFQTKPDTIWIPIGLKRKVWFGNTLDFPSHTTSGFLLADKNKVWLDNLLGCPSHLTMVHAPFVFPKL